MRLYFLLYPGPVHYGGKSGQEELDPEVFKQCKEKMRDVKKALKALDQPDPDHSEEDQVKIKLHMMAGVYILLKGGK